jgi:apolipoprotein N-acyltransferase
MGWFTAGLWWIGTGLFMFTAAGAFGAVAITMLLLMYLSCYPAIAGMLIGTIFNSCSWPARWLMVAASWTTTAWLRGTLFGGLPWLSVGIGQLSGPLSGWAPVGGSLLVEFTTLFVAAALADIIGACARPPWNRWQVSAAVLSIGVLILSGIYLKTIGWTQPMGELTVRLAQGNLPQQEKFSVEGLRHAGQVYGAAVAESDAQLTILPETAFPMTWEALPAELRRNLRRIGSEQGTAVMLGALMQEPSGSITNNLLLIRSEPRPGSATDTIDSGYDDRYVKRHLAFVGEYLPQSLSWLGRRLNVAYSSLSPGDGSIHSLNVESARIAPTICFESLFGAANAIHARDANLLVNVSNFAWFTGTWAGDQDLDVIRMRSLETGRWTARAANTGITAFVDDKGTVIDALPQEVSAVLDGRVELHAGLTPYVETGDQPIVAICGICLTVWAALARSRVARG